MAVRGELGASGPQKEKGCMEWEILGVGKGYKGGAAPPGA